MHLCPNHCGDFFSAKNKGERIESLTQTNTNYNSKYDIWKNTQVNSKYLDKYADSLGALGRGNFTK